MVKMFTVLVFVIQTIHGLASYENSIHDSVNPQQNSYDMQVYVVSSEPSVEMYPAEKTKYGNRENCKPTYLTNIASPSSRGRLYPIKKSGESYLVWFNDSNYFTVDVSENCSSLLLESIYMVIYQMINVTYLKDFLGPCKNEIVIRNNLCDPNVTYSTRLIENIAIPYFSDENRTPVTILMSALAISDSMTALLMNGLTLIAYHKYGHHVDTYNEEIWWYHFDIAECLITMVINDLIIGNGTRSGVGGTRPKDIDYSIGYGTRSGVGGTRPRDIDYSIGYGTRTGVGETRPRNIDYSIGNGPRSGVGELDLEI
ncbi:uncharacterized protein LOC134717794 [Mytilus trossulus]|uniref:uncharacterized protein LOC134717794 n=1 Tax=Mytilus trossulus TaxID=6551 RepID=UPI003007D04B